MYTGRFPSYTACVASTFPFANSDAESFAEPAWLTTVAATDWSDAEVVGPQVFRFEYYYLLGNGTFSDIPWDTATHNAVNGMQDVAAIIVDIAIIDPKSKALAGAQMAALAGQLADFSSGMAPGQLLANWRSTIDANTIGFPLPALSGIRLYERFFYLSPSNL